MCSLIKRHLSGEANWRLATLALIDSTIFNTAVSSEKSCLKFEHGLVLKSAR